MNTSSRISDGRHPCASTGRRLLFRWLGRGLREGWVGPLRGLCLGYCVCSAGGIIGKASGKGRKGESEREREREEKMVTREEGKNEKEKEKERGWKKLNHD